MSDIEVTDREGIQALYDNLITKWRNGWSVANPDSGSCKVIIDTGNLGAGESAIAVQTGNALANGDKISKDSREPVDIEPVTSAPRQDTIALNTDGSVAYYKGVEEPLRPSGREIEKAERPAPPDLQGENVVPLAVVTVPRETETITNSNLIDLRVRADMTFDELRVHSPPELDTDVFRLGDMSTIRAIDHGADPTGTEGSSAALQSAVDEANPGDRVVFGKQGTYYLDDQIVINKRIELDLHEGEIESDYHDMQSYDVGQEYHYYPLFKVAGTQGTDYAISTYVDKGEDQVEVSDPSVFSVGQGVMLRNTQPNKSSDPGFGYQPTITRIRDIENGVIYLEDPALREYSPNSGHTLCSVDLLASPVLKNIHVTSRVEPYFDSNLGKVVGGPRHLIATELTDHVKIENCSVHNYDSHVWTSYDDRAPTVEDVEARVAMNLSGSCGESFWINGTNDVSIVRPKVTEARRGIDVRSGIGEVTVTEPQIASISHIGISWHDSDQVEADITTIGGRVDCKPDDPTMQKDSTLSQRYETQSGIPFNSGSGARLRSIGTDFVSRQAAYLNGQAEIKGGSIYKYRTAGTALSINASDVSVEDCEIGCYGSLSNLVEVTGGENIDIRGVHLNSTAGPSNTVHVTGGSNVTVDGYVTGSAADRELLIEGGDGVSCDVDMNSSANYAYLVNSGSNISIEGDVDGSISNEVIRLDGGTGISIDANLTASGGNSVRGVRIFGGTDIEITGRYSGPAIGIMFSGAATSVNVHDMRVNVTTARAGAVGSDGGGFTITNLKWVNNDMRGSVENILMNDDVDGLWAVNNLCSTVEYTTGTVVGQVYGNGSDAPEVFTEAGGDIQGEVRIDGDGTASEEGLRLSVANDIYPEVDSSATSGDDPNFNVTISDIQNNRPEIHWRRMVNSSTSDDEAFGVYDNTNSSTLFEIDELGNTVVNGTLDANSDLNVAGSGTIDDLTIRQDPGFVLQPAADVESHLESGAGSADRTGFNFQMVDDDGTENKVAWQTNAAARRAFSVWDIDTSSHFFTVDYDGNVSIPNGGLGINGPTDFNNNELTHIEYMDMRARDGSGDDWRFITWDDNGRFVFQLYPSSGGYMDGFEVSKSGRVRFPNGGIGVNGNIDATGYPVYADDVQTNRLQDGSNPNETIPGTGATLSFTGDDSRDIHDSTDVSLSNASGASVTEDVTVNYYQGVDNTGTLEASETQSVTLADASSTTVTFLTSDFKIDNLDYFIEVTTTDLTVDGIDENTMGAEYVTEQTSTGDLLTTDHDGRERYRYDAISGDVTLPSGGIAVNGNIDANGNGIRNLQAETDGLQWSLDSADGSLDWAKLQFDDASGDDIYWTTNRSITDAFRVTNSTAGNDLININDGGLVEVPNGNVEIQGSVSATQPWVTNNTPAGDQALETGDLVQVATTSGGQGDGTFSTSSGTYVDIDNNTTGDLAAMMWDSLPSYSWDDGNVYVSVHVTVSIDAGTVYLSALDTQNNARLTSGEASSTATGFQGLGTTPVAHSPTDLNTRWSFSIRGDGSNTVTYGKNRTVNFYRQVA